MKKLFSFTDPKLLKTAKQIGNDLCIVKHNYSSIGDRLLELERIGADKTLGYPNMRQLMKNELEHLPQDFMNKTLRLSRIEKLIRPKSRTGVISIKITAELSRLGEDQLYVKAWKLAKKEAKKQELDKPSPEIVEKIVKRLLPDSKKSSK